MTMRYKPLGRTGLVVSELCLGTMTFGAEGMWTPIGGVEQDGATALVRQALDAGINFFDTADIYSEGVSETMTGKALRDIGLSRDEYVLATKAYGQTGKGLNQRGASRYHLLTAIDDSLERLGLDHVDLYQIHGWDPVTPVEETLRALDEIVGSGRARYVGVSNWAAWQIAKALGVADASGLERPASLQAYWSLAGRGIEREIVPMLEDSGLGLMVWSPLAGGFLTGKYTREGEGMKGEGRRAQFDFPPVDTDTGFDAVDALRAIAEERGVSVPQVALAWLLAKPAVTSVILGAKKQEQLDDNLGATQLRLSDQEMARLDDAAPLAVEYPGFMLARQTADRARLNRPGGAPRKDRD